MDWTEALEIVVNRPPGHERYRVLTADDHPDKEVWRHRMIEQATGVPAEFPSLATQAVNAMGAAGRAVGAFLTGQAVMVDQAEHDRRMAICEACPELDRERNKCRACGCYLSIKPWGARESCPRGKWVPIEGVAS